MFGCFMHILSKQRMCIYSGNMNIFFHETNNLHSFKVISRHLTLCILEVFAIHIDTISMGLPIVYFKESQLEFPKLRCMFVSEDCFYIRKQCIP